MDCFALLDDCTAPGHLALSRLYTGYLRSVVCHDPATLDAWKAEVAAAQADGAHAVVLADYEWGVRLQGVTTGQAAVGESGGCLRVLLFRSMRRLTAREVDAWLAEQAATEDPATGVLRPGASVDAESFDHALASIARAIAAGETYQVNYTYRIDAEVAGTPLALYRALRARQPVPYAAFIALPPGEAVGQVLSFSPELFVRHEQGRLTTRPMKGTAPRVGDAAVDDAAQASLATAKSRAENLMIVDLLRNDLGRIARLGTVQVPALFEIETYASVFQMTSTITAELPPERDFATVMRALFPCGSVTGAPKHHTMALISALEGEPRGVYCGAIGWLDAPAAGHACGDFCLSVAIRTLSLGAPRGGLRPARLGVGAGIVADSVAADERRECETKAGFFTGLGADFALIETMYATASGVRHGERHLARLAASAADLGFVCRRDEIAAALAGVVARIPVGMAQRVRLLLHADGRHELNVAPLPPALSLPVVVRMAEHPLPTESLLLRHKTTLRAHYDRALHGVDATGAFDLLFFNLRGELTEGARSNIFLRLDGQWLTPPEASGVLPGVMRGVLLDDPDWAAREAILTRADLLRAEAVVVCNALRGVLPARLAD